MSDTGILQVLTADFNGDGNADLVFLQVFRVTVVLGNGDGTFQPPTHPPGIPNPYLSFMVVGDFNHDGKTDVVVFGTSNGGPYIETYTYLGKGDGTFSAPISSPVSVGATPFVADVNGDGNLDLGGPNVIALGNGDGTFTQTINIACYSNPSSFAPIGGDFGVGDFRSDGKLDLASVNAFEAGGAIFDLVDVYGEVCLGNGNGTFQDASVLYVTQAGAPVREYVPGYRLATGDFNGDGKPDMLVLSESYPEVGDPVGFGYTTIFGNGDGTFQKAVPSAGIATYATSAGYFPRPVIADMNGDGKSDLVQIAGLLGVVVFLSNGDGTYTQAATIAQDQLAVSAAVADFNNDGLPDIVATSANVTTVSINTTGAIGSVVNAASFAQNQPVAPGSLVAILGSGIGPSTGSSSSAPLPDSLAGVSVAFNGIPAPLLYVSSRQINAQVPWEVSGLANVAVTFDGRATEAFEVSTAPIAPGVYATATGQALAFNSDGSFAGPNGMISGLPSHPAAAGDRLTVFANGLGPVTPSILDGSASSDVTRTAGPTPVFIGGIGCDVPFAGLSATLAGVNQLSVVVPAGVHGIIPLQINAGGIITAASVTIAVQ